MSGAPVPPPHRLGLRLTAERAAFASIFSVTMLGLLSVGATLPVLPIYVKGPIGGGDLAVGIVTGAFAVTGLAFRPIGGRIADSRGRKRVVIVGSLCTALAGLLYLVPAGVGGLIVARLFLGAGEGMVYTAGSAWIVDLAPAHRRGRLIGLYGLAIWGGLSLGPPIGDLLLRVSSFEMVWAFAAGAPLLGTLIAMRIPERYSPEAAPEPAAGAGAAIRRLIAPEALGPGVGLALAIVGYATLAAFVVLHLDDRGIGSGAAVFTAFAVSVVAMRILGRDVPDRLGGARSASIAGLIEAVGLLTIGVAESLPVALAGAIVTGAGFSLLFPSFALMVVNRIEERRRGSAMGTFTAFFDVGVGLGAPLAGAVAALSGYETAFLFAALCALATAATGYVLGRRLGRIAGPRHAT